MRSRNRSSSVPPRRSGQRSSQNLQMMRRDPFAIPFYGFDLDIQRFQDESRRLIEQALQPPQPNPRGTSYSMKYYSCTSGHGGSYETMTTQKRDGNIAETQKIVRDGLNGLEELTIRREIGNRRRTITKSRSQNGQEETIDTIENMNQDDTSMFDREWHQAMHCVRSPHIFNHQPRLPPSLESNLSSTSPLPQTNMYHRRMIQH